MATLAAPAGDGTRTGRARGQGSRIARTGDAGVPRRMPADRLADGRPPGRRSARMIQDVDELLEKLVRRDALNGSSRRARVRRADEGLGRAPQRARRSTCTCTTSARTSSAACRPGRTCATRRAWSRDRRPPPRRFQLSYLVTAWTQRPEDEHRLLSSLLACFLRNPFIKAEDLESPLNEAGPAGLPRGRPAAGQDRSLADVWSALGGELKPSLDLVVIAPIVVDVGAYTARRSSRVPSIGISSTGGASERARGTAAGRAAGHRARPVDDGAAAGERGREGRRRAHPGERRPSPALAPDVTGTAPAPRGHRRPRPPDPSARLPVRPPHPRRARACGRGRPPARRRPRSRGPVPGPVHLRRAGRRAPRAVERRRSRRRQRHRGRRDGGRQSDPTSTPTSWAARGGRRRRRAPRPRHPPPPPRPRLRPGGDRRRAAPGRARAGPRPALRAVVRLPPRRRLAPPGERRPGARARRPPRLSAAGPARARFGPQGAARRREPAPRRGRGAAVPDALAARPGPGRPRISSATTVPTRSSWRC